jgi:hypothetical protein
MKKLFRSTTKIEGTRISFVDWFPANSLETAKAMHAKEMNECGVPLNASYSVEWAEYNPETLKPL